MSVATELTRIQTAKADIKASIEAKGVTVPSNALIDQYADYIDEISGGGGGGQAEEDLKNLIERDIITLDIPSGTTTIGDYAFYGCDMLTNITIPDSVTTIGKYAFAFCSVLTSINIPSGVTNISQYTFRSCSSLTSITIPSGVTSIGTQAFSGCTGLISITVEATTPPTVSSANAFNNTNDCPIYVPAESVETFKTANNWSSLASRIQAIPTT